MKFSVSFILLVGSLVTAMPAAIPEGLPEGAMLEFRSENPVFVVSHFINLPTLSRVVTSMISWF